MAVFSIFHILYFFNLFFLPETLGKWRHLWLGKWKPTQKSFEWFFEKIYFFFQGSKYTFLNLNLNGSKHSSFFRKYAQNLPFCIS